MHILHQKLTTALLESAEGREWLDNCHNAQTVKIWNCSDYFQNFWLTDRCQIQLSNELARYGQDLINELVGCQFLAHLSMKFLGELLWLVMSIVPHQSYSVNNLLYKPPPNPLMVRVCESNIIMPPPKGYTGFTLVVASRPVPSHLNIAYNFGYLWWIAL